MRASLDTNVVIHFYRAGLQNILFDFFDEGVCIYEQIRNVELAHHGKDILEQVDSDIASGKIEMYTDQHLKDWAVFRIFEENVKENRNLYGAGDLGEVYAISLAQTLGIFSLVTDDTKQGGPYMSLLQFEDSVMPFSFADVLILRYLIGHANEAATDKLLAEDKEGRAVEYVQGKCLEFFNWKDFDELIRTITILCMCWDQGIKRPSPAEVDEDSWLVRVFCL